MELQLSAKHADLVDNHEDLMNLVVSDIFSTGSSGLQSARSERPYSFIRDSLGDSQEKSGVGASSKFTDELNKIPDSTPRKGVEHKTLVSPETVSIPSFRGEMYSLPDGEVEWRQLSTSDLTAKVDKARQEDNEQKNASDLSNRLVLSGSSVVDSLVTENQKSSDHCIEASHRRIASLQEKLAELKEHHSEAAQLAQEARDSERILEFLTSATTDETSFMAEFSALQEVRELWRTTRPELYRLVLKYSTVREQIRLLIKADRDKNYQDVLRDDLLDAKQELSELRSTHLDVYELINNIAMVQSQILSITTAISHRGHLNDRLTRLRAKLQQLQVDNEDLFVQQREIRQLEEELRDLQEFSADHKKFDAYKYSVLSAYENFQLEHPKLVASFLELKQLKRDIDTIEAAKGGLVDIEGETHEAQRRLRQLTESNMELSSLIREKKHIEEDIAEIQNGMQNIAQIADAIHSLQAIYDGIKIENPELVELLERRRTLKDKVAQLRSSVANQRHLEDEVADMQHSFDSLSHKHPDVLLLLDRKRDIQTSLDALKLYATNISILERDIEAKTRTYIELCSAFPDIKEKLLKRRYIEEDIILFKKFSNDPARLARDTLALSNAYEQCRAMSPVITSMLNTRTSLVDIVSESVQCNELGMQSLREVHTDDLHVSISEPPPDPLPPETGISHERVHNISNSIGLPPEQQMSRSKRQHSSRPRDYEHEQEFTETNIANRILSVDLPNMMNSFFGISTQQVKRERQMKAASSPLRRTIS